jgi:hypothetical protein
VIADEIPLGCGRGRDAVRLAPGAERKAVRLIRRLGSATAAWIATQRATEATAGLVAQALQKSAAEVRDRSTRRHAGIVG